MLQLSPIMRNSSNILRRHGLKATSPFVCGMLFSWQPTHKQHLRVAF